MRRALLCVVFAVIAIGAVSQDSDTAPVLLSSLTKPGTPLNKQRLMFDSSFAALALEYEKNASPELLEKMAALPATAHILRHATNYGYDVPKESETSLVQHLMKPVTNQAERIATCQKSLAFFRGPLLADPDWINEALAYLPKDFRFEGSLYLTFGYDIGVAFGNTASLNCTHPHFKNNPRELLYYAIHELHHTGFNRYQKPPVISDMRTCRDLLRLVEYSTQMEGMAVLAAYRLRQNENALAGDPDYIALQDAERMKRAATAYFKDYDYLVSRGDQAADNEAWAVIERMSSGERLWYRVGALMARQIEERRGHNALIALISASPHFFVEIYRSMNEKAAPAGGLNPTDNN